MGTTSNTSSMSNTSNQEISEIRWNHPDRLVWVATADGEFLGMVEGRDGSFIANNTLCGTYQLFTTLNEAAADIQQSAYDYLSAAGRSSTRSS
jgi:hypothetical protein